MGTPATSANVDSRSRLRTDVHSTDAWCAVDTRAHVHWYGSSQQPRRSTTPNCGASQAPTSTTQRSTDTKQRAYFGACRWLGGRLTRPTDDDATLLALLPTGK